MEQITGGMLNECSRGRNLRGRTELQINAREIDCISPRKGTTHRHPRCLLLWAALRQGPERGNEREPVGGLDLSAGINRRRKTTANGRQFIIADSQQGEIRNKERPLSIDKEAAEPFFVWRLNVNA